jgi:hypothetical protein
MRKTPATAPKPETAKLMLLEASRVIQNLCSTIKSALVDKRHIVKHGVEFMLHNNSFITNYLIGDADKTESEQIKDNFFNLLCATLRLAHKKQERTRGLTTAQAQALRNMLQNNNYFNDLLDRKFEIKAPVIGLKVAAAAGGGGAAAADVDTADAGGGAVAAGADAADAGGGAKEEPNDTLRYLLDNWDQNITKTIRTASLKHIQPYATTEDAHAVLTQVNRANKARQITVDSARTQLQKTVAIPTGAKCAGHITGQPSPQQCPTSYSIDGSTCEIKLFISLEKTCAEGDVGTIIAAHNHPGSGVEIEFKTNAGTGKQQFTSTTPLGLTDTYTVLQYDRRRQENYDNFVVSLLHDSFKTLEGGFNPGSDNKLANNVFMLTSDGLLATYAIDDELGGGISNMDALVRHPIRHPTITLESAPTPKRGAKTLAGLTHIRAIVLQIITQLVCSREQRKKFQTLSRRMYNFTFTDENRNLANALITKSERYDVINQALKQCPKTMNNR